jgi:LemA protein
MRWFQSARGAVWARLTAGSLNSLAVKPSLLMYSHLFADERIMQTQRYRSTFQLTVVLLMSWLLAGCGVNNIPQYDEQVKSAWSQVENQYQRRADLIPNLVETVKGFARQEQETLTAVIEARSRATSIQLSADDLADPQKVQQFQQAQNQLTGALSRLMAVSERYPDLKSNQNFLALQSQLEGTENRIAVARRDFIASVERYNTEIRTFPGRIWHTLMYSDMPIRENFQATAENADQAPQVQFQ